jgi:hypothetical protein
MEGSTRVAAVLAAALAWGPGCGWSSARPPERAVEPAPRIVLTRVPGAAGPSAIDLVGVPGAELAALQAASPAEDEWAALLRVVVDGTLEERRDRPAVAGTYTVTDGAIRFRPSFPFDPGRQYHVTFDPSRLRLGGGDASAAWRSRLLEAVVGDPAADRPPPTRVVHVYPTTDEIPENQLRLYVEFSAPMGFEGGARHVRLLDEHGREVEGALLPIDVGLWNADRTRYTLLFDPGRVKRGILPHEESGRALAMGREYTLAIDRGWRDASGRPLAEPFSRRFSVGPAIEAALDPHEWRIAAPPAGTRDPLVVAFPKPLDYALLQRALVVATDRGERVDGTIGVEAAETRWTFTPGAPWTGGAYRLVALAVLEDPAGNRVGRPFEVPTSAAGSSPRGREASSIPFTIASRDE